MTLAEVLMRAADTHMHTSGQLPYPVLVSLAVTAEVIAVLRLAGLRGAAIGVPAPRLHGSPCRAGLVWDRALQGREAQAAAGPQHWQRVAAVAQWPIGRGFRAPVPRIWTSVLGPVTSLGLFPVLLGIASVERGRVSEPHATS